METEWLDEGKVNIRRGGRGGIKFRWDIKMNVKFSNFFCQFCAGRVPLVLLLLMLFLSKIQLAFQQAVTFPWRISWENLIRDQSIFSEVIILLNFITFSFDNVSIVRNKIDLDHSWDSKVNARWSCERTRERDANLPLFLPHFLGQLPWWQQR